jgi:hypothetical protein
LCVSVLAPQPFLVNRRRPHAVRCVLPQACQRLRQHAHRDEHHLGGPAPILSHCCGVAGGNVIASPCPADIHLVSQHQGDRSCKNASELLSLPGATGYFPLRPPGASRASRCYLLHAWRDIDTAGSWGLNSQGTVHTQVLPAASTCHGSPQPRSPRSMVGALCAPAARESREQCK